MGHGAPRTGMSTIRRVQMPLEGEPRLESSENPQGRGGTGYWRNWTSFAGIVLLVIGFLAGGFLFTIEIATGREAPYLGVLYLLFTVLIVTGFVLVPIGMARARRARKAGLHPGALSEYRFDLNLADHRYVALSLLVIGALVILLTAVGSYKSFQATESAEFCGQLCHEVMNPEWVRYNASPHARVRCAECHIGAGADWFVKSKLSGLRQIWAVTVDSFSRPIPTPIHDLRPARETCEECHWRRKFTGYKELTRSYFLGDEENGVHNLRMLIKIGGEKTSLFKGSGIHYHMLIANRVEYIAVDERRQDIAWVRVARADGSITEYRNQDFELTDEALANNGVRTMDCMDCHNRPAHQYPSPMLSVDQALEEGQISRDLPYVKVQAVSALAARYDSVDEAVVGIANSMRDYYRKEYPEIIDKRSAELTTSIRRVQEIYRESIFPEMKADWSAYPDNIGHLDSPGCFRCHTDSMQAENGQSIFTACNKCHLVLAQGKMVDEVSVNLDEGLAFVHPEDFDTLEEFTLCSDCHTGGGAVYE
jgi:nitrate/TMAO reductase-like tetraheme cytochrome c subunit